jgi:cytochrome c556
MAVRIRCLGVAAFSLVLCTVVALQSAVSAEPKVSTYAPAADLANQAEQYIGDLEKSVANAGTYTENVEKIAKDSNTLIIVALALGLNDQDSKYKKSAGALMKAAQDVAAAKDFAAAQKAVASVKDAAAGKGKATGELKWEKVAALPELMKQVPVINTKLKMKIKGANFKKKAKDTQGYTAVMAAISQGAMADTSATKNADEVKQWKKFSAEARDLAGEVNAAIHKGDEAAAKTAMEKLNVSCEDCHAVFKPKK